MKRLFVFCATLILSTTAFAEVSHDNTQCPDLTGSYVIEDKDLGDMNIEVKLEETSGIHKLTLISENSEETVQIDGIAAAVDGYGLIMGACSNQRVYVYEYDKGAVLRTMILSLLANLDLLVEIEDEEGKLESTGKRR